MRQVSSLSLALALVLTGAFVHAQQPPAQQPPPQSTPPPQQGQPAPGTPPSQVPPGRPQGGPPPEPDWKPEKLTNLKVLPKDTTPDQIMVIMRHFRESLGVGCLGCHKGQQGQPISSFDFADDSKENKDIARAMIKLTDDINTKYPDAFPAHEEGDKKPKVTCATCHRRNRHPETEPPPRPPRPEGTPGQPGQPGQRPPAGPPL
jgi:hypothetical protein